MPTNLGKPFSTSWRGSPPHMLRPDVPVVHRFLDKWGWQISKLWYDCLLGGPDYTQEDLRDPLKHDWWLLTAKRADAIAIANNELWLIEASKDPTLRAIGQLHVYRALWLRDPKVALPEQLILVCERIDPDILDAAGVYSIRVFIV